MTTLSRNDLLLIENMLYRAAQEFKAERDTAQNGGAARIYGMQYERYTALAKKLQEAHDNGARRIAID